MSTLLAWLTARNKALAQVVAGVYSWGLFVVNSKSIPITAQEWMLLGGVFVGLFAVHQIPNISPVTGTLTPAQMDAAVKAVLAARQVPPNVVGGK